MTEHSVVHSTFSLERTYDSSAAQVFAAWADPVAKARWFSSSDAQHQLDFRVGGREVVSGPVLTFESWYQEIVPDQRIIYTSTLSEDHIVATVSITTVELTHVGGRTRLLLTESGAFLDGREQPSWREQGTSTWLDELGTELQRGPGS